MKARTHLFMLVLLTLFVCGFTLTAIAQTGTEQSNLYLVVGSEGPGFTSPQEAVQVLEKGILPTFDAILKLKKEGKIIAGGLPVGDRAMVMIVQASSNQEVDKMLRRLPAWGALKWKVTALESFAGRATQERRILEMLKKTTMK
jgi:ABC-type oligopeptide transport system substrate-binding subunit